jgi:hypothetical protein
MGAATYLVYNSAQATTAAPVKQPTGIALRTMMQLAPLAQGYPVRIIEWGCSFDGSAAATPGEVELFATTVAATMSTAYAAADIQPYGSRLDYPANTSGTSGAPLSLGTALSGFATTSVTEGTVANYRGFDVQLVAPTGQYVKQFPLGREPQLGGNSATQDFLRCRMTFGTTVNAYIYVIFEV